MTGASKAAPRRDVVTWTRGSPLAWLAVLWLALGVVLALTSGLLWDTIFFFAPLVWLMFLAGGALLFILLLVGGYRACRTVMGFAPAVAFLALAGALLWASPWLVRAGDGVVARWRFARDVERYDRIVASLLRDPPADSLGRVWVRGVSGGASWVVDPGPPVRIAFVQPGGLIDNWVGIVYDPSDRVLTGGLAGDSSLVRLFGGDLVGCERMGRAHYFRCSFT